MSNEPGYLPLHYRWNMAAFLVDAVCFGIALAFISITSVMPAFVGELTDSKPVIGLVSTVFKGGWLLPQLVAAGLITGKSRKKPYLLAGVGGRLFLCLIALALWVGLARYPTAMLVVLFVCLGLWAVTDGFASISWLDLMARAIPAKRRGRLIGTGQFLSGLAGIGVGALVTLIVERREFPGDYALIFTLACVMLIPSVVALSLLREPPSDDLGARLDRQARPGPFHVLKRLFADPGFRALMVCRLLIGTLDAATPFYVDHARRGLLLPESMIGYFVIAQTLGTVGASGVLGLVSERWGSRHVARIGSLAALAGPLFALLVHLMGAGWLVRAYPLVYVTLGVVNSSWLLGFLSYTMDIAPEGMRATYLGVGNTLMGVLMLLAPMAGGWLLQATSYAALFGLTSLLLAAGCLFTLRLKSPQQVALSRVGHDRPA